MASTKNLVNLDAMILRADFGSTEPIAPTIETISSISVRDFTEGGLLGSLLRKPDFQRETNHWPPEQVASLIESYVKGDLIPNVILWRSPSYIFVIDGGHRLSAIRAWIEDDYGDGPTSQSFFSFDISEEQKRAAKRARKEVESRPGVGSWQHFKSRGTRADASIEDKTLYANVVSRALHIQWVSGDAAKAETSFFQINTKGTPLDEVEEVLLRTRRTAVAISARAIIRAGKGHKYWSAFGEETGLRIETAAKDLHTALFEPTLNTPVKTLDLPLGGSNGVRGALQVLIELVLIATRDQTGKPAKASDVPADTDGSDTENALKRTLRLVQRVTGNDTGSLGLHPAVYFYGPSGRHSTAMFMGTLSLIARAIVDNNKSFFQTFSKVRAKLESALVAHRSLIAAILQQYRSGPRTKSYELLLRKLIEHLDAGGDATEAWIITSSGLSGKFLSADGTVNAERFSDETKSAVFLRAALTSALKCPICGGFLDPAKSVSYDHITRVRDKGNAAEQNCQLSHPYCNQSVKA